MKSHYTFLFALSVFANMIAIPAVSRAAQHFDGPDPSKWAFIAAVNEYDSMKPLAFAENDAYALRDALIAGGFPTEQVIILTNENGVPVSRAEFLNQLQDLLADRIKLGDTILVSFLGHGINVKGTNYLCPREADLTKPAATMIQLQTVFDLLGECKAAQKYLVVDACRNGIHLSEYSDLNLLLQVKNQIRPVHDLPTGLFCMSSCLVGQRSIEDAALKSPGRAGHGVFLYYFIEGISGRAGFEVAGNRDDIITPEEAFQYAAEKTREHAWQHFAAKQNPWYDGHATSSTALASLPPDRVAELSRANPVIPEALTAAQQQSLLDYSEAMLALKFGEVEEAIRFCDSALNYDPDNFLARRTRAMTRLLRSDIAGAAEDYALLGETMRVRVPPNRPSLNIVALNDVVATAKTGDQLEIAGINKQGTTIWLNVKGVISPQPTESDQGAETVIKVNGWVNARNVVRQFDSEEQFVTTLQDQNQQPIQLSQRAYRSGGSADGLQRANLVLSIVSRYVPYVPSGSGYSGYGGYGGYGGYQNWRSRIPY